MLRAFARKLTMSITGLNFSRSFPAITRTPVSSSWWRTSVAQLHRDPPERHEVPAALRQNVVHAARFAATGTTPPETGIRVELHLDDGVLGIGSETHRFNDEAREILHAAQEGLNLQVDGGCGVRLGVVTSTKPHSRHLQDSTQVLT